MKERLLVGCCLHLLLMLLSLLQLAQGLQALMESLSLLRVTAIFECFFSQSLFKLGDSLVGMGDKLFTGAVLLFL